MGATPRSQKMVVIIFDGLGDRPCAVLGDRTPLAAAPTPILDRLAREGRCGLVDPRAPGAIVETHEGTAPLLGLPPAASRVLARGTIEAAGAGLELTQGDVAIRCNLATVEQRDGVPIVVDRRAGRIAEGGAELLRAISGLPVGDGIEVELAPLHQHRAAMRLRGPGLSAAVGDADPGSEGEALCRPVPTAADAGAVRTVAALNRFLELAEPVLAAHPVNRERQARGQPVANALLTRGAGVVADLQPVMQARGLHGAVVAGDQTVLGLARLLGHATCEEPSFTALPNTAVGDKVARGLRELEHHDIVWLHFKGTDIAAHDRDPEGKRDYLERVDAALAPLLEHPAVLAVASDHTTDSNTGFHASDPVPVLLRGGTAATDGVVRFDEAACDEGALGRLTAGAFFRAVLAAARHSAATATPEGAG